MEIVEKLIKLPMKFEPITLFPIGDVQLNPAEPPNSRLKHHIEWALTQPNPYFIGMGDYVDVASPSNRQRLQAAGLYDSVHDVLENGAQSGVDQFLKLVHGTEGRWLGMLHGHHFYEFRDGSTTDTRLCKELKTDYLGSCAFVRLLFKRNKHAAIACTIWAHHGAGSGQKASAPLNRLENLVHYFDADIYLMGHMSKKVGAPLDQLYMTRNNPNHLAHKTKIIAGTGGFAQGYKEGSKIGLHARGGYVEQAMMTPAALGGVAIRIAPVHSDDEDRLDLHLSL